MLGRYRFTERLTVNYVFLVSALSASLNWREAEVESLSVGEEVGIGSKMLAFCCVVLLLFVNKCTYRP